MTYVRLVLLACGVLALADGAIFEAVGIFGVVVALFLAEALMGACWWRGRPRC